MVRLGDQLWVLRIWKVLTESGTSLRVLRQIDPGNPRDWVLNKYVVLEIIPHNTWIYLPDVFRLFLEALAIGQLESCCPSSGHS